MIKDYENFRDHEFLCSIDNYDLDLLDIDH
jgi:hypothetical protein